MRVDTTYEGPNFEPVRRGGSRSGDDATFSCGDKKRYGSERRASLALRWVECTFGHKVIYFCDFCHSYHLGGR